MRGNKKGNELPSIQITSSSTEEPKSFSLNNLFGRNKLIQAFYSSPFNASKAGGSSVGGSGSETKPLHQRSNSQEILSLTPLDSERAVPNQLLKRYTSYETLQEAAEQITIVPPPSTKFEGRDRNSFIIQKQGFLSKKAEFSHGSWKLYSVILKSGKLYFYKAPSKNAVKEYLQDQDKSRSNSLGTIKEGEDEGIRCSTSSGFDDSPEDFEPSAQKALFYQENGTLQPSFTHLVHCKEMDIFKLSFKRYCSIFLLRDKLVICKRKWIQNSLDIKQKGAQGHFSKWKLDNVLDLRTVEALEAKSSNFRPATPTRISGEENLAPSSPLPENETNHGFQLFCYETGANSVSRLFMVKTTELKEHFLKALNDTRSLLYYPDSWYCDNYHPGIIIEHEENIVNGDGKSYDLVIGGSLEALLHESIFGHLREESDFKFGDFFLENLLHFTTPLRFSEELLKFHNFALEVLQNNQQVSKKLLQRLSDIAVHWWRKYPSDFAIPGVIDNVKRLLNEQTEEILIKELEKIEENQQWLDSQEVDQLKESWLEGLQTVNSLGFLQIPARLLAEQLTLFDYAAMLKSPPNDLRHSYAESKMDALAFNLANPHPLQALVYNTIMDLKQFVPAPLRAAVIEHWIKISQYCEQIGNAASWMAITMSLLSPSIIRLRDTWSYVDSGLTTFLLSVSFPALNKSGIVPPSSSGEVVLSTNQAKRVDIPFLGCIRLKEQKWTGYVNGDDVFNFKEQRHCTLEYPCFNLNSLLAPSFKKNQALQELFQNTASITNQPACQNELMEISLKVEPSLDQGYSTVKQSLYTHFVFIKNCLKFIEVIPDSQLFLKVVNPSLVETGHRSKSTPDFFISRFVSSSLSSALFETGRVRHGGDYSVAMASPDPLRSQKQSSPSIFEGSSQKSMVTQELKLSLKGKDLQAVAELIVVTEGEEKYAEITEFRITAGTSSRLMDILLFGVQSYWSMFLDERGRPLSSVIRNAKHIYNAQSFIDSFLIGFRSFCSTIQLFKMMEEKFNQSYALLTEFLDDSGSESFKQHELDTYSLRIRLRILSFCEYWWQAAPSDLMDSPELANSALNFFQAVKESNNPNEKLKALVDNLIARVRFFQRFPDCEAKGIFFNEKKELPSVDLHSAAELFGGLQRLVQHCFKLVTFQDWVTLYSTLENHLQDPLVWSPRWAKQSEEEAQIYTIFMVLDNSSLGDERRSLIALLPASLQRLFHLHRSICQWVKESIAGIEVQSFQRVDRIKKFATVMSISRRLMGDLKIPSFIERAIAFAFVSPECRIFSTAWQDAALSLGISSISRLEGFFGVEDLEDDEPSGRPLPCIGWVVESLLDIFLRQSNFLTGNEATLTQPQLINYTKRMLLFQLINFVELRVREDPASVWRSDLDLRGLLSINRGEALLDLKMVKDLASRENTNSTPVNSPRTQKANRVFYKLVYEQLEKQKKDSKERDRLEKEIRPMPKPLPISVNSTATASSGSGTGGLLVGLDDRIKRNRFFRMSAMVKGKILASSEEPSPAKMLQQQTEASYQATVELAQSSKPTDVINLTGAMVSEHYYNRRDFVFLLRTEQGAQYLLQAGSRGDMQDWIQQLQSVADEATAKRTSIMSEDEDIEQSQLEQSVKVFGVDIKLTVKDDNLPLAIEKLFFEIEARGLMEVGIYRVPGLQSQIEKLMRELNQDPTAVNLASEEWNDVNVLACALKQFFRDLPEPLITFDLYERFIAAIQIEEYNDRLFELKDLLAELPRPHYVILKRLIEHLELITDYQEINRMYATNLAIVFGPNLFRPPPQLDNLSYAMTNLGHQQNIVKNLILQYHWLFDVEQEEGGGGGGET